MAFQTAPLTIGSLTIQTQYNISQFSSDDSDTKHDARIHQALSPDCAMRNVFLIAYGKVCASFFPPLLAFSSIRVYMSLSIG